MICCQVYASKHFNAGITDDVILAQCPHAHTKVTTHVFVSTTCESRDFGNDFKTMMKARDETRSLANERIREAEEKGMFYIGCSERLDSVRENLEYRYQVKLHALEPV